MSVLYLGVVLPAFARAAAEGVEQIRRARQSSMRVTLLVSTAAAIVIGLTAPYVLRLAFSPAFGSGGDASGHARDEMRGTMIGTGAGQIAKIIMTWHFGIMGAAWATLLSELMIATSKGAQ